MKDLPFVFDPECTTQNAEKLIQLYGRYVEGDEKSARLRFNDLMSTKVSLKDLVYYVYHTPFETETIRIIDSIANMYKLPQELLDKRQKALEFKEYVKGLTRSSL